MDEVNFVPLPRESIARVLKDEDFYESYLDALMFLHDLVCEYAESAEHARFHPEDVLERLEKLTYSPEPLVNDNIAENRKIAQAMRVKANKARTDAQIREAELEATAFVESLLRFFTALRMQEDAVNM